MLQTPIVKSGRPVTGFDRSRTKIGSADGLDGDRADDLPTARRKREAADQWLWSHNTTDRTLWGQNRPTVGRIDLAFDGPRLAPTMFEGTRFITLGQLGFAASTMGSNPLQGIPVGPFHCGTDPLVTDVDVLSPHD